MYSWKPGVVGEHLGGEVYNVERMETSATQLEMTHYRLGGDVGVDGLIVSKLADPCVVDVVDDEGATVAFDGFIQLEILPQRFLDGLRAGRTM